MSDKKIEKSPQHSPLPWKIHQFDEGYSLIASTKVGRDIISGEGVLNEPDAQLIVRTVNSHEMAVTLAVAVLATPFGITNEQHESLKYIARKF